MCAEEDQSELDRLVRSCGTRHSSDSCTDSVVVVALPDGGLISYEKVDGDFVHTLNTPEGLRRKLLQLGIRQSLDHKESQTE